MDGGDNRPPPPSNGGEFLLRLVQNNNNHPQNHQQPPPYLPHNLSTLPDPAVAAVGPTIPIPNHHRRDHHPFSPFSLSPNSQNPNFFPKQQQGFHLPSFSPPSNSSSSQTPSFYSAPHQHFDLFRSQQQQQQQKPLFSNSPFSVEEESLRLKKLQLELDLFKERELGFAIESKRNNGFDPNSKLDPRLNWVVGSPDHRGSPTPPGFLTKPRNPGPDFELFNTNTNNHNHLNHSLFGSNSSSSSSRGYEKERRFSMNDISNSSNVGVGLSGQLDHPGLPSGSSMHSDIERSFRGRVDDNEVGGYEIDDLSEQLVDSVLGDDQIDEKNDVGIKKKHFRDKDFRSDARGKWILPQRTRNNRRLIECRRDIDRLDSQFLAIYESLIPVEEEKAKQKQLLTLLEQLVCKEWPNAKLYVYGSCANSFGVSKSDIDVCLAIDDQDINKSEMLLKLADILQSGNLQDVQALTRARVPVVKLMDPVTGISCDICINNVLAVVNTKLLRDYAEIDVRLRQLAFLVKHWAKSRGVNETYHGTLSSYAYVLMCIHFLQMRNPPILPCLQNMKTTYAVTVDDIECTFFDQVEMLRDFGSRNRENISKLLWGFFSYWAYCHDYANQVISVRSGCILSKQEKNWTRRVGNDRHLICIEDPFETSHDLGRVVDKYSIRVLREEFERAAEIMQCDPNPCVTLFEPYIPR